MDIKEQLIELLSSVISQALIDTGKSVKEIAKLTNLDYKEIKSYVEKTNIPNLKKFLYIADTLNIDAKKVLDLRTYVDFK